MISKPKRTINDDIMHKLSGAFSCLDGAYSNQTLRAYRADIKAFVSWCVANSRLPFPAQPETVAAFIGNEIKRCAPSTIRRRLAAIRKIHAVLNYPNPCSDEHVKLALRRALRAKDNRPHQAFPLNAELRDQLLNCFAKDAIGLRNRTLIALGYDTMARRSELVAMRIEDIQKSARGSGKILIRRSKNDPLGRGRFGIITPETMTMLEELIAILGTHEGYLFRSFMQSTFSTAPLHPQEVNRIIKKAARKAKLPTKHIQNLSGHSMRIGAAQDLMLRGLGLLPLMVAGGWKSSNVVMRYVENIDVDIIAEKLIYPPLTDFKLSQL